MPPGLDDGPTLTPTSRHDFLGPFPTLLCPFVYRTLSTDLGAVSLTCDPREGPWFYLFHKDSLLCLPPTASETPQ